MMSPLVHLLTGEESCGTVTLIGQEVFFFYGYLKKNRVDSPEDLQRTGVIEKEVEVDGLMSRRFHPLLVFFLVRDPVEERGKRCMAAMVGDGQGHMAPLCSEPLVQVAASVRLPVACNCQVCGVGELNKRPSGPPSTCH